ncbi:hypothetical protein JCM13304A_01010 [Desulfothermus okinawensis JCM 13304]
MEQSIRDLNIRNYLWINAGLKFIHVYKTKTKFSRSQKPDSKAISTYGVPPYKYVITYYNLHEDIDQFLNNQNPRTILFKNMIGNALKWQFGYIFIPCTKKIGTRIVKTPDLFWTKVSELKKTHKITHILIFGKDAHKTIVPHVQSNHPYFIQKFNSYSIICLPSPEDMLPDNREMKKIAWHFLRKLSKPLNKKG